MNSNAAGQGVITPVDRSLPGFTGVAPGQTATVSFPIGPTYHYAWLNYANLTLAQMLELRLVANGEVIRRYSGADLDAHNQFDKRAAAGGMLFLDFERRLLLTRNGRELTALGTGMANDPTPIVNLTLECDIDAAAVGPTLSGKVAISGPSDAGLILKNRIYTYNPTAAGDFEISDLPKKGIWSRIWFGSASVNSLKIERNNQVIFDRTATENSRIQSDGQIRAPQAGWYVYDLTEDGYSGNGLDPLGVSDMRFFVNMAAAGALKVVVESLEEPTPVQA